MEADDLLHSIVESHDVVKRARRGVEPLLHHGEHLLDRLQLPTVLASAPLDHPVGPPLLEHDPRLFNLIVEEHEQLFEKVASSFGRSPLEGRAKSGVLRGAGESVRGRQILEVSGVKHGEQMETVRRQGVCVVRLAQVEPVTVLERSHQPLDARWIEEPRVRPYPFERPATGRAGELVEGISFRHVSASFCEKSARTRRKTGGIRCANLNPSSRSGSTSPTSASPMSSASGRPSVISGSRPEFGGTRQALKIQSFERVPPERVALPSVPWRIALDHKGPRSRRIRSRSGLTLAPSEPGRSDAAPSGSPQVSRTRRSSHVSLFRP